MSEYAAASISGVGAAPTPAASGGAAPTPAASGGAVRTAPGIGQRAGQAAAASASASSTTQSVNQSHSSISLVTGEASYDQKMAILVLALIEALLGRKEEDDDAEKLLAGLVGMLAFAPGNPSGGFQYSSLELNQSSQVTQTTTTTNTAAVQASAYDRAVTGADTGGGSPAGGNLDVVA